MTRAMLKAEAKQKMKAHWGIGISVYAVTLIYFMLQGVKVILAPLIGLVFSGVMSYGYAVVYTAIIDEKETSLSHFFEGFSRFGSTFCLHFLRSLFTALWSLLFVIPGIIKALSYSMAFFVLQDHEEMTGKEALNESKAIMKGHEWDLFVLYLSFFGWYLLCVITFGIASFYVVPYQKATLAAFYRSLCSADQQDKNDLDEPTEDENNLVPEDAVPEFVPKDGTTVLTTALDRNNTEPCTAGGLFTGVSGGLAGQEYTLPDGMEVTVGRDPTQCGIVTSMSSGTVSHRHCVVCYSASEDAYHLTDVSSNGTSVNGMRLEKGVQHLVYRGSTVTLAEGPESFRLD